MYKKVRSNGWSNAKKVGLIVFGFTQILGNWANEGQIELVFGKEGKGVYLF